MISMEFILILSCHALPFSVFEVNILHETSNLCKSILLLSPSNFSGQS